MKKKVLVINLGWEQTPLIDRLSEKGFELYGIHYSEDYYRPPIFEEVLVCDLRNLTDIVDFAGRIKPDAVISDQCDYSQFAQAVIAEKFGLPGPRIEQAQTGTNKYIQRLKSEQAGVKIPEYAVCTNPEQALSFAEEIGYPVILKPVDNRGSFGVNKVHCGEELYEAYFSALVNSHSRYVLVEKFISGVQITVDGYCFPGYGCKSLALATKKMLGDEKQVAVDILYPGELDDELYERAMTNNEFVNNVLGFKFGMLHSEYMIDESGDIYLIETANRGGGVFTSEIIVPAVSGIDLLEQYISDISDGSKSLYQGNIERNKTLLKFFSFSPGYIKDIAGLDDVVKDDEVKKLRLIIKPGDTIQPVTNDADRHGFFILSCENGIRAKAEKLEKMIKVVYE